MHVWFFDIQMYLLLTTRFKGNLFPYGLPATLSPITIISHHNSLSALSLFKGVLFCLFLFGKFFLLQFMLY